MADRILISGLEPGDIAYLHGILNHTRKMLVRENISGTSQVCERVVRIMAAIENADKLDDNVALIVVQNRTNRPRVRRNDTARD